MAELYRQLLDATIQHLEELKAHGQKFVIVSPEALESLKAPVTRRGPTFAPVRSVASAPSVPVAPPAPAFSPTIIQPTISTASTPTAAPLASQGKAAAMVELRERALVCQRCPHLAVSRKNVVFGVGDIDSPLMFVGEAPGADEDVQGEPFVGAAGQLLTKMIVAMGFTRQAVYIANILKCRPDTPGQAFGNRKPTSDEMKTCLPYLLAQIDLIQPKVIVALGATAVEGLLGKTAGITKLRGHWQTFHNVPVMPTYHPAYLLRNQAIGVKREVWEDLMQVMDRLALVISERQRGFFLRG